jgi:predicted HicB family RNase H-like nuclease
MPHWQVEDLGIDGKRPFKAEKPYSETLSLRIAPELHRSVAEKAAKAGESINQFIAA